MKLSRLDPDMTAEQAAAAVLSVGDPRSKEYREGLESRLDWHFHGKPKDAGFCRCPYAMGATQADAWLAGQDRADFEIQRYQAENSLSGSPTNPGLLTPISWVPGRDATSENLAQVNRLADTVRGMATALVDETANAKIQRSVMNPDHPNGRLGMIYTDSRTQHAERVIQVLNRAADELRDLAYKEAGQ